MFKAAIATIAICSSVVASAQNVTFDAVKISELVVAKTWPQVEAVMPVLMSQLDQTMKSNGATEQATRVALEELRSAFNRDGMARVFAALITSQMSTEEQQETLRFLLSTAGNKYLQLSQKSGAAEYGMPLINATCAKIRPRLSAGDLRSLAPFCN